MEKVQLMPPKMRHVIFVPLQAGPFVPPTELCQNFPLETSVVGEPFCCGPFPTLAERFPLFFFPTLFPFPPACHHLMLPYPLFPHNRPPISRTVHPRFEHLPQTLAFSVPAPPPTSKPLPFRPSSPLYTGFARPMKWITPLNQDFV